MQSKMRSSKASKTGCVSTIKTKIVDFCFVLSSTFTTLPFGRRQDASQQ